MRTVLGALLAWGLIASLVCGPTAAWAADTVVILSDFGTGSTTPALCHGALAAGLPDVRVIDLSHDVPAGDPATGAVMLRRIANLPVHTIVLGLAGTGTVPPPQLVAFQTSRGFYCIGPNDGLFGWVVKQQGVFRVVEIDPAMVMPGFQGDGTDTWNLLVAAVVRFCKNDRDLLSIGRGFADSDLVTGGVSECSASRAEGDVKGIVLREVAKERVRPEGHGLGYAVLTNLSTGALRLAGLRLDEPLELEVSRGDERRVIELRYDGRSVDASDDSASADGRMRVAVLEDLLVLRPLPDFRDLLTPGASIVLRRAQ
ncbi:MAG: SAM-dependent chlorinase/fluorinase [Candidatus Eisenbacteria bacterium]|uniref:SAM-dependent chlorinase/fluorinase n=1 Tax=Eiseniibacteriota bacterium TaxID=2212470 RepID=A0A956SEM1_UNCEI|nr:SAM-dependent chlorinase/fluorinase [Candidatus Eisenbacteria bacterium]